MASLPERLHYYRLCYNGLRTAQSRVPPGEATSLETRLQQAELRCLEELILMYVNVNPTNTNEIDNAKIESQTDVLDVSLVTNFLLLSQPSPWIVYVVDTSTPECQLCYVSPSLKRMLGWRPSDVVGKPIFDSCHPEDVQVLRHVIQPQPSRGARCHKFDEYVSIRRMRRDQTIASLHGTGIAINSRWYAWVEQDTIDLKLAHVDPAYLSALHSSVTLQDGKSGNNARFDSKPLVDNKAAQSKPEPKPQRAPNMKSTITNTPTIATPPARSIEIKHQNTKRQSSVESLPANIVMSPNPPATQAQKSQPTHDKSLDLTRGKSVLMVDDSATYLKGGQALLRKMGCQVFVATNGEDALEIMKHASPQADLPHQFDIVFMDLSMPKMGGIQVVKLFRNWEAKQEVGRKHTLIIAVTANDTDGGMVLCAQTGFDGFVTKPLTKRKILDCLAASSAP